MSWWEFSGAQERSEAYGKFLADGLTRSLVAARAREMSARTGGYILLQLLFDLTRHGGNADRVLNAPTNDAWITPWVTHLRKLGVELRLGAAVVGIECSARRITGVTIAGADGPVQRIEADHYVAALPVEQLRLLISPEMRAAEPRLASLDRLVTRWMNGIMFYLDEDVALVADKLRWKALRRSAKPPLEVAADGGLRPTGPLARVLVDFLPRLGRLLPGSR